MRTFEFRRSLRFPQLYRPKRPTKRNYIIGGLIAFALLVAFLLGYAHFFGPVAKYAEQEEFIVAPDTTVAEVAADLKKHGFIKSAWAFRVAYSRAYHGTGEEHSIVEGGYEISRSQDAWTIAEAFAHPPYLAWVTIRPGLRKEEIAEILQKKLGWTDEMKEEWLTVDTETSPELQEGVYFGDTYLIPSDQAPAQVAERMRARFNEVFAPYAAEAAKKGLSWNEVITLASLVEREAAKNDKALVAGIMWNRIDIGMGLQIDATLQYIRGKEGNWWPVPKAEDKKLDSLFNTYKYKGLPPHPIASPSIESIIAAVRPEKTNCIFYLHDNDGVIHCSQTYAGQLRNVNTYLK